MSAQPVRFLEPVPDSPIAVGATLTDLHLTNLHAVATSGDGAVWLNTGSDLWLCVSDQIDEPTEPPACAGADQLLDWWGPITIRYEGTAQ